MKKLANPTAPTIFTIFFCLVFVVTPSFVSATSESLAFPLGVPLLPGCATNYGFSVFNGLPCSEGAFASPIFESGTDLDDTSKPALISGCASDYGFSIFSGQSCAVTKNGQNDQNNFFVPGTGVYLGGWKGWNGLPNVVKGDKIYFARPLDIGSSGYDVRLLQSFLATDKELYPEGFITGYFGLNTSRAVGRLQIRYGLVKSSSESTYGFVGPKTRALLNSLAR